MTGIKKKLDDIWSLLVKAKASYICEYCGKRFSNRGMNAHHLVSRVHFNTRWDVNNGICLCCTHHTFSFEFSAHKTPEAFRRWLATKRGETFYDDMKRKSQEIFKLKEHDLEKLYQDLKGQLDEITKSLPDAPLSS